MRRKRHKSQPNHITPSPFWIEAVFAAGLLLAVAMLLILAFVLMGA
jgi:hypothetical protein